MVQVIYSYEPLAQRPMTSPESGIGLLVGFRRSLIMSPTRHSSRGTRPRTLAHRRPVEVGPSRPRLSDLTQSQRSGTTR
jgi:hypothetical protein